MPGYENVRYEMSGSRFTSVKTPVEHVSVSIKLRIATVCSFSFFMLCTQLYGIFITALHEMQTRSCDEISVCPSVRPSVKRVDCDKTKKISPDFYTLRKIIHSSFVRKKEWLVGATPST